MNGDRAAADRTGVAQATSDAVPPQALSVADLSHSFGARRALDGVSFAIREGEIVILLGQNGAGKTTLFSLITRLYSNRSGSIRVFDSDLRRDPLRALSRIGVVFQQRTLDLDLSVTQNLLYHAALHGLARREARERAMAELARLGLAERAGDKVRQLSGGQLRRVEIARALLHRPRLLLLDEPTVGLDIGSRQGLIDHVRSLCHDSGLALLWATHLIDEIAPGDRVIVLHKGRILANGEIGAVVAEAGAKDIREAFTILTADPGPGGGER